MRTCIFDIETTGFNADFGRLICAVVKEYHQRSPCVILPADHLDDTDAVLKLKKKLESFDIIVGHYTKGFDIPYLNAKLFLLGEPCLSPKFHLDTYYISKHHAKQAIRSKSLKHLVDVLGFEDQKKAVRCKTWNDAKDGYSAAIKTVVDRCISDVVLTEGLYSQLLKCGWVRGLKRE